MNERVSPGLRSWWLTAQLIATSGCATFGGNIKADFACAAPDGTCAPSATIDDRALAMISGEGGPLGPTPTGRSAQERPVPRLDRAAAPTAVRTGERVLRIVFPAHVDSEGRLHETAAVRAVVATGHWQPADMLAAVSLAPGDSLAEVVDRADPPATATAAVDPDLPNPAAIAAARARLDPVAAIKADVVQRLNSAKSSALAHKPAVTAAPLSPTTPSDKAAPPAAPAATPLPFKEPTVGAASFPATTGDEK